MYRHHKESIERLGQYFQGRESVIAVVLDGSVVKGNARPDSDIDAIVVVTEEAYARLAEKNRLAEVIHGHCTYPEGYFDVKYKTKRMLEDAAARASEPPRNAYVGARVLWSQDEGIAPVVAKISAYPEAEVAEKIACFWANLKLNADYFLSCTTADNAYMRAHLAQEIVYSVYRLILIENRVLFPCNRRLEAAIRACENRPKDILELGATFLADISAAKCSAFVDAFRAHTKLVLNDDISSNCSTYVKYYEDWWMAENPPFPNEW